MLYLATLCQEALGEGVVLPGHAEHGERARSHGSQSCHQRVLVRDPRDALASLLSTALFEGGGRGLGFKVFRI